VRELRNVLERALLMRTSGGDGNEALQLAHVGIGANLWSEEGHAGQPDAFEPGVSYRDTRARWEADFERRYAKWLLARHDGNISAAAREADMDRKYLHKLVTRHGLK
jgi:DNA-binding NtrC family response regulator